MKESKICSRCKIEKKAGEFYIFRPKNKKVCLSSACKKCDIKRVMENYSSERRIKRHREYVEKIRLEAFKHYGGEKPSCHCCGEDRYEFLVLDHINDDGKQQRILSNGGSGATYKWLKRNNWPNIVAVSCHNCNLAREFYGICPHKIKDYAYVTSVESAFTRRNPKRKRSCPSSH